MMIMKWFNSDFSESLPKYHEKHALVATYQQRMLYSRETQDAPLLIAASR